MTKSDLANSAIANCSLKCIKLRIMGAPYIKIGNYLDDKVVAKFSR